LPLAGVQDGVQITERIGELARGRLTDARDAERIEESRELGVLCVLDGAREVVRREVAKPLEPMEIGFSQGQNVREVGYGPDRHEAVGGLRSEAANVERIPRRKMHDGRNELSGTRRARRAPLERPLPMRLGSTRWACPRHAEWRTAALPHTRYTFD